MIMVASNFEISLVLNQMERCRIPRITFSDTRPNLTAERNAKLLGQWNKKQMNLQILYCELYCQYLRN